MKETTKEKQFKVICQTYVQEIYSVSMYLVQDKVVASNITRQVFGKFYRYFEIIHPDLYRRCLLQEARNLVYELKEK